MTVQEPTKTKVRNSNMKWIAILSALVALPMWLNWLSLMQQQGVGDAPAQSKPAWTEAPTEPRPRRVKVTRAELGPDWPLTVDEGELFCEPPGLVGFTASDGRSYALNGTAGARYLPVEPIWARDRKASRLAREDMRVSLGPLMAIGLGLCE